MRISMTAYLICRQGVKFSVGSGGYGGACAARENVVCLWRMRSDGGAGMKYVICCWCICEDGGAGMKYAVGFLRTWEDGGAGMEYIVCFWSIWEEAVLVWSI